MSSERLVANLQEKLETMTAERDAAEAALQDAHEKIDAQAELIDYLRLERRAACMCQLCRPDCPTK